MPEKTGEIEVVKLRNGSEEALPLVRVVALSIDSLLKKGLPGMLSMYEAVQVARNRDHKIAPGYGDDLVSLALVDSNGHMHESIRNIIEISAQGEGLEMEFVSPVAKE